MHSTRYMIRPAASTCGGRAARCAARPNLSRAASHWAHGPSHYGRFPIQSDFAPFLRLLDDASSRAFDNFFPALATEASSQVYQPRFDVREVENAYELRGELPGVQGENLSVEFTDAHTLTIKGHTQRETTSGTPPAASSSDAPVEPAGADVASDNISDTASVLSSSSYQKPSIEDANENGDVTESSASGVATPTSSVTAGETNQAPSEQQETQQQTGGKYWMSERSVGEFQRSFTFSTHIDQDGVHATLKDGILSVTVPKAKAPAARRINVD